MDTPSFELSPVPASAQGIVEWIMGNSPFNRDTIKEMLLSQQFPYIEDACLSYLRSQLLSTGKTTEEDLARIRKRILSISTIRTLQNGFMQRATAVLDSFQVSPTESL